MIQKVNDMFTGIGFCH